MTQAAFQHKKGDSFDYTLQIPLTIPDGTFATSLYTPTCKIRDSAGTVVASNGAGATDIVLTWDSNTIARALNLLVKDTTAWTVAEGLVFDVQLTRISDSYVVSTGTVTFDVIQDVTY